MSFDFLFLASTSICEDDDEAENASPSDLQSSSSPSAPPVVMSGNVIQTPLNPDQFAWLQQQQQQQQVDVVREQEVSAAGASWTVPDDKNNKKPDQGLRASANGAQFFTNHTIDHNLCIQSGISNALPPPARPKASSKDAMLAIRSGIPLALQNKRRRQNKSLEKRRASPSSATSAGPKRGEVGVRKDLTLPSAPTPGEDNVFTVRNLPNGGL